jgi:taurine dioxygenase
MPADYKSAGRPCGDKAGREMSMSELRTQPLEPFGVALDHDFRAPLSPEAQAEFKALIDREGLALVRGPVLTMDQQVRMMEYLGPILNKASGRGYVAPDDGVLGTMGLDFHSDISFTPEPFEFLSLHAVEVVDGASWTEFMHAGRGYQRLPERLKARLEGLEVTTIGKVTGGEIRFRRNPVMRRIRTGAPILYMPRSNQPCFEALLPEDSAGLLEEVFSYVYTDDNIVHHDWCIGDLVVWDNLALQHARPDLTGVHPRRLQRVVVANKSLLDQAPADFEGVTYEGMAAMQGY